MRAIIITSVLFLSFFSLKAQNLIKRINIGVGMNINTSTSGETPFWLRSNKAGSVDFRSNYLSLNSYIKSEYDSTFNQEGKLNSFDVGYEIEPWILVGNKTNELRIIKGYFKVRLKSFELFAGRRSEVIGIVDSTISSGSYAYSQNTIPIPQIKLHNPNYIPLIGKGLISFKGSFSHGWFGEQVYLKKVMLHHKSLYLKLGKEKWKTNFYGGFNHQIQWGGELNSLERLSSIKNGKIPSSLIDYLYAVTGITLNKAQNQGKVDIDEFTGYDLTNRIGNHFGSIDLGIKTRLKVGEFQLYRQSVYDDGSLYYLINISDGLTGFSFNPTRNRNINKVLFEYFDSRNQGGSLGPEQSNSYLRGTDNYFNHGQYLDGWSYKILTLGSPLVLPQTHVLEELQLFENTISANVPFKFFTSNNRTQVYYLAVGYNLFKSRFLTRGSYSQNLGTYRFPFIKQVNQLSLQTSIEKSLKNNLHLKLELGYDSNGIIKSSFGSILSIYKAL